MFLTIFYGNIPRNLAFTQALYMVGTSNLSVPDMAIDIMEDSWDNYGILWYISWDVSWDTSWLKKLISQFPQTMGQFTYSNLGSAV